MVESGEHDPLEDLRSAWSRATPPNPGSALDAPDVQTRATLAYLRAHWHTARPRSSGVPWKLRLRYRRREIGWIAAAAAAAAVLFYALLRPQPATAPSESVAIPVPRSSAGSAGEPARPTLGQVAGEPTPAPIPASPHSGSSPASLPAGSSPILLAALDADHMELRSGPVRLILLTPGDSTATDTPTRSVSDGEFR